MSETPNPERSSDVVTRRPPAALINELRLPAEAITRSLQRLGLAELTPAGMPAPPAGLIIKRARIVAAELQGLIEELIALAGPAESDGPTPRLRQDRLPVRLLILEAVEELDIDERVSVSGSEHLTINTYVPRLQEILSNLFGVARQRSGNERLHVSITTIGLAVGIEVAWADSRPERVAIDDPDTGIPYLRTLVASLGGRLETVTEDHTFGLRLLLPQQRAQDRDDERASV